MMNDLKFQTRQIYLEMKTQEQEISWWKIIHGNAARLMAIFTLWLACHERLATKERMFRFGFTDFEKCYFCNKQETLSHMFFFLYSN